MKGRTTSTTPQSEDQRELFETTDIRTQDDKSWASSTIYLPPPLAFFSIPSMASSWWLKLFSLLPFLPEHYCNRLINMQRQGGSDQEKLSSPSSFQEYLRIERLRTLCTLFASLASKLNLFCTSLPYYCIANFYVKIWVEFLPYFRFEISIKVCGFIHGRKLNFHSSTTFQCNCKSIPLKVLLVQLGSKMAASKLRKIKQILTN